VYVGIDFTTGNVLIVVIYNQFVHGLIAIIMFLKRSIFTLKNQLLIAYLNY